MAMDCPEGRRYFTIAMVSQSCGRYDGKYLLTAKVNAMNNDLSPKQKYN